MQFAPMSVSKTLDDSLQERLADFQRALGHLCMTFAQLELVLGIAVAFLAGCRDPRTGLALIAELSFKARLTLFSTLFSERLPAIFDKNLLKEFLSKAHKIEGERNRLIHSWYWAGSVGEKRVTRIKATAKEKKGLDIELVDVHPDEVTAVAERASALVDRLDELCRLVDDFQSFAGPFYALFRRD